MLPSSFIRHQRFIVCFFPKRVGWVFLLIASCGKSSEGTEGAETSQLTLSNADSKDSDNDKSEDSDPSGDSPTSNSDDDDDDDTQESQTQTDDSSTDAIDSGEGSSGETNDDGTSAEEGSGDDGEDPVDCDSLPALPLEARFFKKVEISEDFTFSKEGSLINASLISGALGKTSFDGSYKVMVPGAAMTDSGRGIRILNTGDFALVDLKSSSLLRIGLTGSKETLVSNIRSPNGLAIGKEGQIFMTSLGGKIYRVDPESGESEVFARRSNTPFDGIVFSPDYRTLYVGELSGRVFGIPVGDDGQAGSVSMLAKVPIVSDLDGLAMDKCGNIYGSELGGNVWRIDPKDGAVEKVTDLNSHWIGRREKETGKGSPKRSPSLNFGPTLGGWSTTSLYIMVYEEGLYEVDVGVPGAGSD